MIVIQTEAERQAELAMVGWAIANPDRVLDIELEPGHFDNSFLGRAWQLARELCLAGEPVDAVLLASRVAGEEEGVGPSEMTALARLSAAELQAALFPEDYARVVRESWVTRQVLFACSETIAARQEGVEAGDLLSLALEKLSGINLEQTPQALPIGEIVRARYEELAELATAKAKGLPAATGVPTGVRALDQLLGGLQRGICTVVAARPGMGKSAFAMAVTDHVSSLGVGGHVFSLEDTRSAYADRSMSRRSGVPATNIRACELTRGDLGSILHASSDLASREGWIVDDRSGITPEEIVRSVRRENARNETQLVVVDYVQLLKAPPGVPRAQAWDKTWVASHAMDVFGDAAKRDGMAYLVLSQLNRECEKRLDKRPILSDLKQSGAIEERAKCVLMLFRPNVYDENAPEDLLEILVRKNSNGPDGMVTARWTGPTLRIE